jgi:hypothetical protein
MYTAHIDRWLLYIVLFDSFLNTCYLHRTENLKHKFPEMKLRGLIPNLYIHVSVSYLYIPMIGPQQTHRLIVGI